MNKHNKPSALLKITLFGAAALAATGVGRIYANSSVTDPAWPLLPGQNATVDNCEGRVYDSNGNSVFTDSTDMRYRVFVPPNYNSAIKYPVILWLHGNGADGNDNTQQLSGDKAPVLHLVEGQNCYNYPCILIAPQRQGGNDWYASHKSEVFGIMTDVFAQYSIDPNRIYICGVSSGSFGTYSFLTNNTGTDPYHFAAAVAISGNCANNTAYNKIDKLVGFPIWQFHAKNDGTVDIYSSYGTDWVAAKIRELGGSPMYTRYDSGNHTTTVWDGAFSTPFLLPWLMSQRLENGSATQHETTWMQPGVIITGYRVGSALDLEGVVAESSGSTTEVDWFNSRVSNRSGTVAQIVGNGGSGTQTIAGANFTSADVGSKLFYNDTAFETWNGYKITAVTSSTTVTISPAVSSVSGTHTNVGYEIDPPGHRRNPAAVTGTTAWTATGIVLSSGTNVVGTTGKTASWANASQGGSSNLDGQVITINYSAPSGDTVAPQMTVGSSTLLTTGSTITLSGTATDNTAVSSMSWTSDHSGSGTVSGTAPWTTSAIALDPGNNIITVKAVDTAGNMAVKIFRVMRNIAPVVAVNVSGSTQQDTGCIVQVLSSGSDADAQPQTLSLSSVGTPSHGTASIYGNAVKYKPSSGYVGGDSFSYTLTDGTSTATAQVNMTVNGVLAMSSTTYFSQDYSSSGTYTDYASSTPNSGQVNDISAGSTGGTWSINGSKLQLTRSPSTSGTTNGAGMTRFTDLSGPPQFVKVAFDFTVVGGTSTNSLLDIDLCNLTSVGNYTSTLSNSSVNNRLTLAGKSSSMALSLGGYTSATFSQDGSTHQVAWYVNGSAQLKYYVGPDGYQYNVDSNHTSLWVDGVMVWDNIPRSSSFTGSSLADFRIRSTTTSPITLTLDNLSIAEQVATFSSGDTTAPVVGIAVPTSGTSYATSSATLATLSGTASDNYGVTGVTWLYPAA